MNTPIAEILYDEINELRKLLLTPQQLKTLAFFIEQRKGELYSSLLQELTPKYLRERADAIELLEKEEQ